MKTPPPIRDEYFNVSVPLICCSFFLSVANSLGSAGKISYIDTGMGMIDAYSPLIEYSSGLVFGCLFVRTFEKSNISDLFKAVLHGSAIASAISVLCAVLDPGMANHLNFFLGIALGVTIISLRALLGSVDEDIGKNMIAISVILTGMPIFIPLAIILLNLRLKNTAYLASVICCLCAMLCLNQVRRTGIMLVKFSTQPVSIAGSISRRQKIDGVLAVSSLVSINASLLISVLTLPIFTKTGFTLLYLLSSASVIWLVFNVILIYLRSVLDMHQLLLVGLGFAAAAISLAAGFVGSGNNLYYLFSQVVIYIATMLIQGALFSIIARSKHNSIRIFGLQSALQVFLATIIVILAVKFKGTMLPSVAGQLFLMMTSLACSLVLLLRAPSRTQATVADDSVLNQGSG